VIAVWDDNSGGVRLPQARMFNKSGDPVGEIFWVSERDQTGISSAVGQRPRIAWRDSTVAIIWESLNSPDTFNAVVAARIFDVTPNFVASAQLSDLTPRTATIDINPTQNNTSTESTGVGIAGNGNVIVGWEDDSTEDYDIFFFGAVWTVLDSTGTKLIPTVTITNTPHPPAEYMTQNTMNSFHRAYFRANGTPTPGNTAWGPKIKANRFGDGMGMGATAYYLGFEVPELFNINLDAGGGGDFPAVQLLNNDGTAAGIVSFADSDAEPTGDIRIGDWEHLANGNIVIVGESRQAADRALTGQPSGNTPVFRIVTAAGAEVKGLTAVSAEPLGGDMWHGVGVTANGFAVRFGQGGVAKVRVFDNSGNPKTGNINLATLTGEPNAAGGGRGDGAGFHGNGRDAYVHIANGAAGPWVTVLNSDGTLRWSRKAAEDHETIGADRVDAAIAHDGRVIAAWDDNKSWTGGAAYRLPQARVFKATGAPLANRFWISERDQPAPGGTGSLAGQRPRVAWRDNCVAIIWESLNSADTFNRVVAARIFDVPFPPFVTSVVDDGGTITVRWTGGGPTYSVYRKTEINGTPSTVATGLNDLVFSEFKDFQQAFYYISSP